jgi:predicted cupin superfamily sugar epimerase
LPKGFTLVTCLVGPGFDFADFCLLQGGSAEAGFLSKISLQPNQDKRWQLHNQ